MCVSALLLFLALVSYSPLDPSWNSASVLTGSHAARNWIGVVGAFTADMMLQFFGIGAFLLVIFPAMLGTRWFRSMKVQSPLAKSLGGIWLVMFVPALLALLPGHLRWMQRDSPRRPARPRRRRRVDSLPQYRRRLYRLRHGPRGRALSLDGILVFGDSALGSDAVRLRDRAVESLQRLAAGARQETPAEGTRPAADFEACGEDTADSVSARVADGGSPPNRDAPASSA